MTWFWFLTVLFLCEFDIRDPRQIGLNSSQMKVWLAIYYSLLWFVAAWLLCMQTVICGGGCLFSVNHFKPLAIVLISLCLTALLLFIRVSCHLSCRLPSSIVACNLGWFCKSPLLTSHRAVPSVWCPRTFPLRRLRERESFLRAHTFLSSSLCLAARMILLSPVLLSCCLVSQSMPLYGSAAWSWLARRTWVPSSNWWCLAQLKKALFSI